MKQLEIRQSEARENAEKKFIFNGIHTNVKEKLAAFELKCSADFTVDENVILKMYKDVNSLNTDFKDILDWVDPVNPTKLSFS